MFVQEFIDEYTKLVGATHLIFFFLLNFIIKPNAKILTTSTKWIDDPNVEAKKKIKTILYIICQAYPL